MAEKDEIEQYTLDFLESDLKQSHKDFAREYFVSGWNQVKSYMKVYPDSSYAAAAVSANDLLKNPKIRQYLNFLKEDLEKACYVNKASMLTELLKIASANISQIHDDWIELAQWEEIKRNSPDVMAAIESIDTKTELKTYATDGEPETNVEIKYVKVKFYAKTAAINEINLMMGYRLPVKNILSGDKENPLTLTPTVILQYDGKPINLKT